MAPLTGQVQVALALARTKGWLMQALYRAGTALRPSRTLRPVELSPHLQRDIGIHEWPSQTRPRRFFELGDACGRR